MLQFRCCCFRLWEKGGQPLSQQANKDKLVILWEWDKLGPPSVMPPESLTQNRVKCLLDYADNCFLP